MATEISDEKLEENSPGAGRKKNQASLISIDSELLQDVDVTLTVILGRARLSVKDMFALTRESELALDTPLDGSVDIMLHEKLIGKGEIVAVSDRFGVKITEIMPRKK